MSHEIAKTADGKDAIAYVGETPWHGLGQELTVGAPLEVWRKEAGLDFEVKESPVTFANAEGVLTPMGNRKVLYRSDTSAPLGVVGDKYRTVQPQEAIEFFRDLTEDQGFQMETAGVLSGGQRIWALAKMSEGANVISTDRVRPYVLLATSFDGGLATTVKRTAIRVVCNNTITMALAKNEGKHQVKVHHGATFDAAAVKKELQLVQSAWDSWLKQAKILSEKEVTANWLDELTLKVSARLLSKDADEDRVRDSKAYKRIVELFNGAAIGSELAQGGTAWQWLNSVTQYVDHEKGNAVDSRLRRAWFGDGDAMKSAAWDLATA